MSATLAGPSPLPLPWLSNRPIHGARARKRPPFSCESGDLGDSGRPGGRLSVYLR